MNIQTLRVVGLLEGLSFLLLLFIAMPMKYMFDNPVLVKYVGMGHGVLFILFLIVLFAVCEKQKWSITIFLMGLALIFWRTKNKEKIAKNLLQQQKHQIAEVNEELGALNEELKTQMEIVSAQNIELEKLNNVKNKFFSINK